jgi:hypothetical protein
MSIKTRRFGRRSKGLRRLHGPRALLAALNRRRNRLRDATQALAALRCSLAAEASNVRAGDAVLQAYLLADRRLRGAIEEIAIPALRRCGEEGSASADEARFRLEEALPDHVDEALIREASWSGDGWA